MTAWTNWSDALTRTQGIILLVAWIVLGVAAYLYIERPWDK